MEEKRIERIERKIDSIAEGQGEIHVHIAEIKKDLRYHIKRTDILEHKVMPIWTSFKAIGLIGGVAVGVAAVMEIISYLSHK